MDRNALLARLLGRERGEDSSFVLRFLADRDPKVVRATLDRRDIEGSAASYAALLSGAGVASGDAVVLALGASPDFVGALLGAMAIGAVPVPVPVPTSRAAGAAGVARFETVVAHCAPRAIVGEPRALARARAAGIGAAMIEPSLAGSPSARSIDLGAATSDAPAFIQYTAGSTGSPKGVVVTFDNLHANLEAIGRAVRVDASDRVLSWLPLYHDMGLVGALLFSLYWDVPLYLFSPAAFVLRPVAWLEAISAHRATLSPAPHFAYSICALKLRDEALAGLDLSSWRLALDGAEPIHAQTARAFVERFRPFGLSPAAYQPVYGLSEATLAVTFPALGEGLRVDRVTRSGLARKIAEPADPASSDPSSVIEVVSVGRPLEGVRVEIRAPGSGEPLPDRRLGEICVSGPSVSPRYLNERTAREVLHTGDLGYFADGALYVADRLKDIIIHAGSNVYPSDVEEAAGGVRGIRRGRVVAFGVAQADVGTEDVVVAAEVERGVDRAALPGAIREAVQQHAGVAVGDVVLLEAGTLPLTTSGKLMRSRVRESYVQGTLEKRGLAKWISGLHRRTVKALSRR